MAGYKEVIAELEKKGIAPYFGDFFDPDGFLHEYFLKNFGEFAQEHLDRDDMDYDVRPARFYYNDLDSLNALARTVNGLGMIEVNMGAIHRLLRLYIPKEHLFEEADLIVYRQLAIAKDVSPSVFMFQMVSLFLFYHETGHLIQQKEEGDGNDPYVEFLSENALPPEEVRIRHMREMDADWFAGQQMAFHIKKCAEDLSGEGRPLDLQMLRLVSSLALAAIYMYFVFSAFDHPGLYLEEHSHPHPLVRLSYMVSCLFQNIEGNVFGEIPQADILKEAIRISERLMLTPLRNIVRDYSIGLHGRLKEVEDYIKQIMNNSENYPFLWFQVSKRTGG
jgi:hypothetical protein